jgi:hypothetical protein
MNNERIKEIASRFMTYEEMYNLVSSGDFSFLSKKLGTNEYPQIRWMIEYFAEKEEYEKCQFLSNLEL